MHPGEEAPQIVNSYIEMVPTDTVKYELDKTAGLLKVDRHEAYEVINKSFLDYIEKFPELNHLMK